MTSRVSIRSFCLLAAVLLAGCDTFNFAPPTPTATLPAPTVRVVTVSPLPPTAAPLTPTSPAEPTRSAATATTAADQATVAPVDTASAAPTDQPPINPTVVPGQPQVTEAILLLTPGNGGSVSSPVRVSGQADPTFEQTLVIKITSADGTLLATQATTIQGTGAVRGPFDEQVPFTVTAAMPGRILVYATSARDGGLIHLASADVTLLSGCCAEPVVGQLHNETHIIQAPAPQASVSGGRLHVSGFSDYVFESQLSLVLCGEGGSGAPDDVCGTVDNVLATGTATLSAPDVGQAGPFAGDLTYQVSGPVAARLAVFSRSARDGGLLHLSTVPVTLAP